MMLDLIRLQRQGVYIRMTWEPASLVIVVFATYEPDWIIA